MAIYLQYNKGERFEVKPTIFPDKTSQVWKVPGIEDITDKDKIYVYWMFEQEAEVIWLFQLCALLCSYSVNYIIPYWPYARQDKILYDNNHCFASIVFQRMFSSRLSAADNVYLLDAHSPESYQQINLNNIVHNYIPYDAITEIVTKENYNLVLMPDEGAFKRYRKALPWQSTHCVKRRNQSTGEIEFIAIPYMDFRGKRVLIVDDICDGGATFIQIAKRLKENYVEDIGLRVTHGIFSKGKDVLYDAGINNIYTHNYEAFYQQVINE